MIIINSLLLNAILLGSNLICHTIYSEKGKVSNSYNECTKCNSDNHRSEFFNGKFFGECICEESYYDDKENSICVKCPEFWLNY